MDLREKLGALEPTSIDIILWSYVGFNPGYRHPTKACQTAKSVYLDTFLTLPKSLFRLLYKNRLKEDKVNA